MRDVAQAIVRDSPGIDFQSAHQWLLTYQYGLCAFDDRLGYSGDPLNETIIVELGGGTGANAAVHAALSPAGVYIFDLPPMLAIQQATIKGIAQHVPLCPIEYFSKPQDVLDALRGKKYIVVSYWAFTEFPETLRRTFDPLLQNAVYSFFACNPLFEGIDNLAYFESARQRLAGKDMVARPIDWNPYKKHMYVMMK